MMIRNRLVALAWLLLAIAACTKVYPPNEHSTPKSPTSPTSPTPATTKIKIEFRVSGNANGARVRYSNAVDGLTQVVTTLPFVTSVSTTEATMFLSLEATPTSYNYAVLYPFLSVQILADGALFREATASDALLNTLVVSGTWRR